MWPNRAFLALALLCLTAPLAHAGDETVGVLVRHIAGDPGVNITQQRGNVRLVATTGDWGGTEEATQPPTVIVTQWTSGGLEVTVTVTQGPNEPIPDFTRRVDATVRAMQNLRPRDGAATGPLGAWMPSVSEMIQAAEHWANVEPEPAHA